MGESTGANTKKLRKFSPKSRPVLKKRFPGREIKTKILDRKETTYDLYV